jgi:hypothetical protein
MKNFMLGVLAFWLFMSVNNWLYYRAIDKELPIALHMLQVTNDIVKSEAIVHTLTKRCCNDVIKNNLTARQYFQCNSLQIKVSDLLFGEYAYE